MKIGAITALPREVVEAIESVQTGLALTKSIRDLAARLPQEEREATARIAQLEEEVTKAEVDFDIAKTDTQRGEFSRQMEAGTAEIARVREQLTSIGRKLRTLPYRMGEAHDFAENAIEALQKAIVEFEHRMFEILAEECETVARQMADIMRLGHAVVSGFGSRHGGEKLQGVEIPDLRNGGHSLIHTSRVTIGSTNEDVSRSWRDDKTASAIGALLEPLKSVRSRANSELYAIRREREKGAITPTPAPSAPQPPVTREDLQADHRERLAKAHSDIVKPVPHTFSYGGRGSAGGK